MTSKGKALVLLYAAGAAILLFYPFRFELPVFIGNAASWQDGRVAFPNPGLLRSTRSAEDFVRRVAAAGAFSIELVVTSFRREQSGDPARIVVLSDGPNNRNFVVGQNGQDLVFRIRTGRNLYADLVAVADRFPAVDILADHADPQRKNLGRDPQKDQPLIMVRNFFAAGQQRHVTFSYDGRSIRIFSGETTHLCGPVADDGFLANWDPGYAIAIGNEVDGSRPWLGRIEALRFLHAGPSPQGQPTTECPGDQGHDAGSAGASAALRVTADGAALWADGEAQPLLAFIRPERFVYMRKTLRGITARELLTVEAAANVLLLIPFGALAAFWFAQPRALRLRGLATIAGLALLFSVVVEGAQFFIATRYASLVDVASYLLGALIGWWLWIGFARTAES